MKINVTRNMLEIDGRVIRANDKDVNLRECLINVLAYVPASRAVAIEDKIKRYKLAKKIFENETPDISAEEIVLLKKLLNETYGPTIVGQACEILESSGV